MNLLIGIAVSVTLTIFSIIYSKKILKGLKWVKNLFKNNK